MFVNRKKELQRLSAALQSDESKLIVIYGRRRLGKSTLLKQLLGEKDVYFSADLRSKPLQIAAVASTIEKIVPGFAKIIYPDWESLFTHFNQVLNKKTTLVLDEFPYLVKNSPELPSVIQKITDNKMNDKYNLILCGSSQQMMYSITLDSSSPLYGRCDEIIRVRPMSIYWLREYLSVNNIQAVEEYSIWGGVPRYWEIRKNGKLLEKTVKYNLLDPDGVLYDEPERLIRDEMRTSVLAFSVLSLIATGSNRISEIAGRLGKPATQLSRIMALLTDLGYIKREIPFGSLLKSSKKTLYKIADPFVNFYFTFIIPNKSNLEYGLPDQIWEEIRSKTASYVTYQWEELCRNAVPLLPFPETRFNQAFRWWGTGTDRKMMEVDVVAESLDKKTLLMAEVKWSDHISFHKIATQLNRKCEKVPFAKNKKIIKAIFLKYPLKKTTTGDFLIFYPEDVINALK
jgi:AAA+ ATPase superfamily predicted ATPase